MTRASRRTRGSGAARPRPLTASGGPARSAAAGSGPARAGTAAVSSRTCWSRVYPPGLTRGMQLGLGVVVVLVAVIGYRGLLRRHPLGRARRQLAGKDRHGRRAAQVGAFRAASNGARSKTKRL